MDIVADNIHDRINFACTTYTDCAQVHCTTRHGPLQGINLVVNSCDKPPSVDMELVIGGDKKMIHADHNITTSVDGIDEEFIIDLWHFDYSMDVEVYHRVW